MTSFPASQGEPSHVRFGPRTVPSGVRFGRRTDNLHSPRQHVSAGTVMRIFLHSMRITVPKGTDKTNGKEYVMSIFDDIMVSLVGDMVLGRMLDDANIVDPEQRKAYRDRITAGEEPVGDVVDELMQLAEARCRTGIANYARFSTIVNGQDLMVACAAIDYFIENVSLDGDDWIMPLMRDTREKFGTQLSEFDDIMRETGK